MLEDNFRRDRSTSPVYPNPSEGDFNLMVSSYYSGSQEWVRLELLPSKTRVMTYMYTKLSDWRLYLNHAAG